MAILMLVTAFACGYGLPLFFPPPPLDPSAAGAGGFLARVFPGVPATWVTSRLLALAFAALALGSQIEVRLRPTSNSEAPPSDPKALLLAASIAVLLIVLRPLLAPMSVIAQPIYLAAIFLPGLILIANSWRVRTRPTPARDKFALLDSSIVIGAWFLIALNSAVSSYRTADLVDLWPAIEWFRSAAVSGGDVLTQSGQAGIANAFMLFQGLTAVVLGLVEPTLEFVQVIHISWIATTAFGLAWLVQRISTPSAATIATAAFLFSPFVLALRLSPSPFGLFMCMAVLALCILAKLRDQPDPAWLAALATVAGLATMSAHLLPLVAIGGLATIVEVLRRQRKPLLAWILVPALCFILAAGPGLPSIDQLQQMHSQYVAVHGDWALLERIVQGQVSPFIRGPQENLWSSGASNTLEIAAGAFLSPAMSARTPIRLWGDSLFEPISVLFALGAIASAAMNWRRLKEGRGLLGFVLLALLPAAFASAFDRTSPTRNLTLPLAMASAAGLGWQACFVAQRYTRALSWATVILIAGSGLTLFEAVGPKILPASSLSIAVEEAKTDRTQPTPQMFDYGVPYEFDWLHVGSVSGMLATPRFDRVVITNANDPLAGASGSATLFWSPALNEDFQLAARLCETWPNAHLYELRDRTGHSKLFAARPKDPAWQPGLNEERWNRQDCR